MVSELQQLHLRKVFKPFSSSSLTLIERKQPLESHLFLKEMHDLSIKGKLVAGGNKQRNFTLQSEATSPTTPKESIIITAAIDAMEIRYMAGIDIPNAFEQSDLKSDGKAITIIMVLRDKFALRMIKTAPEVYVKHVTKNKYVNMIFFM